MNKKHVVDRGFIVCTSTWFTVMETEFSCCQCDVMRGAIYVCDTAAQTSQLLIPVLLRRRLNLPFGITEATNHIRSLF